jgi:hypothetical protein
MHYQTHWRLAFLLAFFFQLIVWLVLMVVIPQVFQAMKPPPEQTPMEWVDIAEETPIPVEEPQEQEPEPEPPPPPPPPETEEPEEVEAVVEAEIPEEAITEILKDVQDMKDDAAESAPKVLRSGERKQMGQPGKILHAEQPPFGVIDFKGRIAVSAHIGKDGKVMYTRIMISSGNLIYDRMARRIVETKWKFTPASDVNGEPMESDMQCPVYFNMKPARKIK